MNNKDDDKLTGARGFLSINVERGGRYRRRSWVSCNHQQRDDNDDLRQRTTVVATTLD